MTESCLFCRIVSGELPVAFVAQNEYAVAFRDINPQAPMHVLVVPKRHLPSLAEASDSTELGAMALLAAQVARTEGFAETGYRTVMNTGAHGGQTVLHLHLHVLGGRAMGWPPG